MRKITLLTIAMFCIYSISNAQITKGSTFLGGSFSLSGSSTESDLTPIQESKNHGWSFSPQFGKAVGTNKIVGVYLNFGQSKNEATNGTQKQESNSSFYGGGFFYRNYFPFSSRFYLFGEAALGLGFGKDEQIFGTTTSAKTNRTSLSLDVTPGLSFAATKKLYLEAALNSLLSIYYQSNKQTSYNPTGTIINTATQKQYGLSGNANGFSGISIGLRWILPSKK